jgi:hypothetical protein
MARRTIEEVEASERKQAEYTDYLKNISDRELYLEFWDPTSRYKVSLEVDRRASRLKLSRDEWVTSIPDREGSRSAKVVNIKSEPVNLHERHQAPISGVLNKDLVGATKK